MCRGSPILHAQHVQVLGVMAQLISIPDEHLARVLSAQYRSLLTVLAVATNGCRQRLTEGLQLAQRPLPDFMCMTHAHPYRGDARGEVCVCVCVCVCTRMSPFPEEEEG